MTILLLANTIFTGLMFVWWNRKDWLNTTLKVVWFTLFVSNLIFLLKEVNFI